jgi:chemosensory pili system protein ChpC
MRNNGAIAMNHLTPEMTGELSTLIVPLHEKQLLLPNVSLAEIVNFGELAEIKPSPDWVLGMLAWRKHSVPVISFETLNEDATPKNRGEGRIAVLNTVSSPDQMPFIGILIRDIPRMTRVAAEELATDLTARPGKAEQLVVMVNGEKASIPDLDAIEKRLLEAVEL